MESGAGMGPHESLRWWELWPFVWEERAALPAAVSRLRREEDAAAAAGTQSVHQQKTWF